jgi:hypothetical protein
MGEAEMSNALDRLAATPGVAHGTAVEQARAVADVFAAADLALRKPRDEARAEQAMLAACSRPSMAERAEYALPRGAEKNVTGPTVHLARELARIWGNITHGVVEISRDPERGQSELLAYSWDVESNTRSARTFIVPHTRDKNVWDNSGRGKAKKVGTIAERIDTQQDITNQNNSVAARQLREVIFSVLPQWFTEDAITRASATRVAIARGDHPGGASTDDGGQRPAPKPLAERSRDALAAFTANGITREQLEGWAGGPHAEWTDETLANVGVLFRSLQSGDATVAEVFGPAEPPPPPVTMDELGRAAPAQPEVQDLPADAPPEPDPAADTALKTWEN